MKINLFTDCLGAGGAQRQLVGLAVLLKEKGFKVGMLGLPKTDVEREVMLKTVFCVMWNVPVSEPGKEKASSMKVSAEKTYLYS